MNIAGNLRRSSLQAIKSPATSGSSVPRSYDTVVCVYVACAIVGVTAGDIVPFSRYLSYAVPLLIAMTWLVYSTQYSMPVRPRFLVSGLLLSIALGCSIFGSSALDRSEIVQAFMFTIVPISAGAFINKVTSRHIGILLAAVVAGQLVALQKWGLGSLNLLSSEGILESQMSFPALMITIAAFAGGIRGRAYLGAFILITASKRIAFVAAFGAWAANYVLRTRMGLRITKTQRSRFIITFLLFASVALATSFINDIAVSVQREFPQIFPSVNALMMGRYTFSETVTSFMENNFNSVQSLTGFGVGSLRRVIGADYFSSIDSYLLHNDYLFVQFEYGIVGVILMMAAFSIALCKNRSTMLLAVAQCILFATDNTYIYAFHILSLLMCEGYLSRDQKF